MSLHLRQSWTVTETWPTNESVQATCLGDVCRGYRTWKRSTFIEVSWLAGALLAISGCTTLDGTISSRLLFYFVLDRTSFQSYKLTLYLCV